MYSGLETIMTSNILKMFKAVQFIITESRRPFLGKKCLDDG